MVTQRFCLVLSFLGLGIADAGVIQIIRSSRFDVIPFIVAGLLVATAGLIGVVVIRWSRVDVTPSGIAPTARTVIASTRFGLPALLLGTALVCVCLAGLATHYSLTRPSTANASWKCYFLELGKTLLLVAPMWLPFIAMSHAIGRRSVTALNVIFLAIGEIAALAALNYLRER
jgi:hypothetical protein